MGHKHNHIVPNGYLKGFATKPEHLIIQYDKQLEQREPFLSVGTYDAAVLKKYYWLKNAHGDGRKAVERYLSDVVEDQGLPVIKKLRSFDPVTAEEKKALGRLIGTQFTRVPRFRRFQEHVGRKNREGYQGRQPDRYKRISRELLDGLPDGAYPSSRKEAEAAMDWLNGELIAQTELTFHDEIWQNAEHDSVLEVMKELGGDLGEFLSTLRWKVLHVPSGYEAVTNDNPMVIAPVPSTEEPTQFIPLASDCILLISMELGVGVEHDPPTKVDPDFVELINAFMAASAERFVYGRDAKVVQQAIEAEPDDFD